MMMLAARLLDLNKKLFEPKSPRPWIIYGKIDGAKATE
jgi:hypothetical protein